MIRSDRLGTVIVLAIFILCTKGQDRCQTPYKRPGYCIWVEDCPPIDYIWNNTARSHTDSRFLKDSHCKTVFFDQKPKMKVCCDINVAQPGCRLPEYPNNGSYEVEGHKMEVGTRVPISTVLIYECESSYLPHPQDVTYCQSNVMWDKKITCEKPCKNLFSDTVELICQHEGIKISCDSKMLNNTIVTSKCKSGFIEETQNNLNAVRCFKGNWNSSLPNCIEKFEIACNKSTFGCCSNNETAAHGPLGEGCCIAEEFGCCLDNISPAKGIGFKGCECKLSRYGCCPDNITFARGYNNTGCGCQYTPHGCCPNRLTPASGPNYEGCPCYTFQFGCCADGKGVAQGLFQQGCFCSSSKFGCCPDGQTAAVGPDSKGCDCTSSKFECCPDGITEAKGKDFEGCKEKYKKIQESCLLEKESGPCQNFTIKWFFDMEYGECSRFWHGGCGGNDNAFESLEDCRKVCVEPQGKDICQLPQVKGPCEGYNPNWYYDTHQKRCNQFVYGGCLGNSNRFLSKTKCEELCDESAQTNPCLLEIDPGYCKGSYERWAYNLTSSKCESFNWGGCGGNDNKFLSKSICIQKCDPPGKTKDICSQPKAVGNCTKKIPKWFFDWKENHCMPFYYSGCEGNGNQFDSEIECNENCFEIPEQDVCSLLPVIGNCNNYTNRWFYNSIAKRCYQFYYGGCEGNENNFQTENECEIQCNKTENSAVNRIQSGSVLINSKAANDFLLNCAAGGYPEPVTTWFKDNIEVVSDSRIQILANNSLIIRDVSESDSGTYRCDATNDYFFRTNSLSINVEKGGIVVPKNCVDHPYVKKCSKVIASKKCSRKYHGRYCCRSCLKAGLLSLNDFNNFQYS